MKLLRLTLILAMILTATGCSEFTLPFGSTVTPAPSSTAPESTPTSALPTPAQTATSSPPSQITLRLWVPPQFDPAAGTAQGELLKSRLEEFTRRRPNVQIEVRVKALDGPGGLLDSLTTANAAAPLALPDLVALNGPLLETAALKGLLRPYDGLTSAMENPDWYEFARQLAHLQSTTFGLPFAGDVLALVYRPAVIGEPPATLEQLLAMNQPLAFPASDPDALFTLMMYQAAGGEIYDDQGRPTMTDPPLTEVLTFYQQAEIAGIMPFTLTQFEKDDQIWQAFQENQVNWVITWASRHLGNITADTAVAPLPTPSGEPFTYASGWVWALATPKQERLELSTELAEFLTESTFLSEWSRATGLLPPRPSALENWSDTSLRSRVNELAASSHLYPTPDALQVLGPAIQAAVIQVLKEQVQPGIAAEAALQAIASP